MTAHNAAPRGQPQRRTQPPPQRASASGGRARPGMPQGDSLWTRDSSAGAASSCGRVGIDTASLLCCPLAGGLPLVRSEPGAGSFAARSSASICPAVSCTWHSPNASAMGAAASGGAAAPRGSEAPARGARAAPAGRPSRCCPGHRQLPCDADACSPAVCGPSLCFPRFKVQGVPCVVNASTNGSSNEPNRHRTPGGPLQ